MESPLFRFSVYLIINLSTKSAENLRNGQENHSQRNQDQVYSRHVRQPFRPRKRGENVWSMVMLKQMAQGGGVCSHFLFKISFVVFPRPSIELEVMERPWESVQLSFGRWLGAGQDCRRGERRSMDGSWIPKWFDSPRGRGGKGFTHYMANNSSSFFAHS